MEVYKKEATELEEQLLILRKQGRPEEILQKASRLLEIAQLHQDSYYIAAALYFQAFYEYLTAYQDGLYIFPSRSISFALCSGRE